MSKRGLDPWYRIGKAMAHVFMPTFGRIEVIGRENVPPFGPLIVAANHLSNADPPILVYAMNRPIWFMAKRNLFAGPIPSYFLRNLHAYPVDRDGRDVDAVRWAQSTLDQDRALVVFPEGTRSDGHLQEGTDGLTYLALRSQAPILPVGISGTERIPGFIRVAFPFCRMRVHFGLPFTLPAVEGRLERPVLRSLTDDLMRRIAALLPEPYQGIYGKSGSLGALDKSR